MDYTLLLLIIIVLLIWYYNKGYESFITRDIFDVRHDRKILHVLRKMVKDIDGIFRSFKMRYWLDGASLLGIFKYGNILENDFDIDLCLWMDDEYKLTLIQDVLYEHGYGIFKSWSSYKIFPLNGIDVKSYNKKYREKVIDSRLPQIHKEVIDREYYPYRYPYIDVYICRPLRDNKKIIHYDNKTLRDLFKGYYYKIDELFPLMDYKFENTTILGPNKPYNYLKRNFTVKADVIGHVVDVNKLDK